MVLTTASHSTVAKGGDADYCNTSRRFSPEPRWRRRKSFPKSIQEPNNLASFTAKISIH